jgi:hypothetical protein
MHVACNQHAMACEEHIGRERHLSDIESMPCCRQRLQTELATARSLGPSAWKMRCRANPGRSCTLVWKQSAMTGPRTLAACDEDARLQRHYCTSN